MVVVAGYKNLPIENPRPDNRFVTSYQENFGKSTLPARPQTSQSQNPHRKAQSELSVRDEYSNAPKTPVENKRMTVSSNRKFGEYAQPAEPESDYKVGPPICKY
jgi:hypothetical protein